MLPGFILIKSTNPGKSETPNTFLARLNNVLF